MRDSDAFLWRSPPSELHISDCGHRALTSSIRTSDFGVDMPVRELMLTTFRALPRMMEALSISAAKVDSERDMQSDSQHSQKECHAHRRWTNETEEHHAVGCRHNLRAHFLMSFVCSVALTGSQVSLGRPVALLVAGTCSFLTCCCQSHISRWDQARTLALARAGNSQDPSQRNFRQPRRNA